MGRPFMIGLKNEIVVEFLNGGQEVDRGGLHPKNNSSKRSEVIAMKLLRRLLPLVVVAIALTLTTQVHPIPPPPEGPVRNYPTEFPLSKPNYTSKRLRDFGPFESALAKFSPERRRVLDGKLLEATVPKLQELMQQGAVTAEELVVYYVDRIRRYDVNQLNSVMELNPDALEIARNLDSERKQGNL